MAATEQRHAANDDDRYAPEVIRTVTELTKRTERMARLLDQSITHADEERAHLIDTVNATVESMRKDVFKTVASIQLDARQHRDEHAAERKERATDAVDRLNRQLVLNVWLGALTALVVLNLLLIGFVVVRTAQVMIGS